MHSLERSTALVNQLKCIAMAWFTGVCLVNVATAQVLKVIESDNVIVVRRDAQDIVTYNKVSPPAPPGIDSVYERSGCLHPVNSPRGANRYTDVSRRSPASTRCFLSLGEDKVRWSGN